MSHLSYKGKSVDMGAMLMMNEHKVALGNANMNARGDLLGAGGSIIKTREELANEFYQQSASPIIETDEDVAVDFDMSAASTSAQAIPMETFDASLLEGYDDVAAVEPVAPKARKKAPTGE